MMEGVREGRTAGMGAASTEMEWRPPPGGRSAVRKRGADSMGAEPVRGGTVEVDCV